MKSKTIVTATALFCAALIGSSQVLAAPARADAERERLTAAVVKKWSGYVARTYKIGAQTWAREMAPAFADATTEELAAAAAAQNFDSMNQLLLGAQPLAKIGDEGGSGTQALGDLAADLVFVPVAPCRLFDTRLAGGQIAANTVRSFDVTAAGDYSFQGGSATDCNGVGSAGSFAAAVINLTVVEPAGAGYITAFPWGGVQPLASTVNFVAGDIIANLSLVRLDQSAAADELNIYTYAQTHLVGDIVGYLINPTPTALQCVEVVSAAVNFVAGATHNVFAPACTAGYTAVETQCRPGSFDLRQVGSWAGHCNFINEGAGATTAVAAARCCRVPGR